MAILMNMDDELERIREEKLRKMQETLEQQKNPEVLQLDQVGFREAVDKYPFLVVDFWAEWCGPCAMLEPVIIDLAREFGGKVMFGKCNTDESRRVAIQYNISAIPTILLFSHGRMVERIVGVHPKDVLRRMIIRAFGMEEE